MEQSNETILFGDRADFAIEAGVDAITSQVWGHLCVWCRGVMLGDLNDPHCGMAGAANGFRKIIANSVESLWDESLNGLSDLDAWNILDGAIYGMHGDVEVADDKPAEQLHEEMLRYSKFDFLTGWDEMFDDCKAFILCPPNKPMRILCRTFPESVGLGLDISRSAFVETATSFVKWFDEQSERIVDGRNFVCPIHGKRWPTLVCKHLVNGEGLGFIEPEPMHGPDESAPDRSAWCDECNRVRNEHRGWNEVSIAFAGVTPICDICFEAVRKKNQRV